MKKIYTFLSILFLFILLTGCSSSKIGEFKISGDVGRVKIPGKASYDKRTDTYTLSGAGFNMWGKSDAFFLLCNQVEGDFSMSSDIAFEGDRTNHRKIGIIVRQSLEEDSPCVYATLHGDGLTALQYRKTQGDITYSNRLTINMPEKMSLERKGDRFIMKISKDGSPLTTVSETEVKLPKNCYVGIYICSHDDNTTETAYFKNLEFKKHP